VGDLGAGGAVRRRSAWRTFSSRTWPDLSLCGAAAARRRWGGQANNLGPTKDQILIKSCNFNLANSWGVWEFRKHGWDQSSNPLLNSHTEGTCSSRWHRCKSSAGLVLAPCGAGAGQALCLGWCMLASQRCGEYEVVRTDIHTLLTTLTPTYTPSSKNHLQVATRCYSYS